MKKRVGILTSGGDCPGLNATIRGVAKALYARMGDNVEKAARSCTDYRKSAGQSAAQAGGAWPMSKKKLSKLLALYLPYVVIGLVATNLGEAWRLAVGKELGTKLYP